MKRMVGNADQEAMTECIYRVKILAQGRVVSVAHIDDVDMARNWAYDEMKNLKLMDKENRLWAATVESGTAIVDPYGIAKTLFVPDREMREGLVLDGKILKDPNVDHNFLFGLS